jgi:hypothetical protein
VVKTGQTLAQVAKENDTTVKAILADPRNAVIAARVEAGEKPVFGNSKVAIPQTSTPAATPAPASAPATSTAPSALAAAESGAIGAASVETQIKRDTAAATPVKIDPISGAQISGPVKGFTPPFQMPEPKVEPGDPKFTGPVAPIEPIEPPAPIKEERTMAIDTFRNTLALFFGAQEVTQPWVNALYGVTSKYYKTGSTIDESLNLALQDVRNNPELAPFTKRFKGVYELQDKLVGGMAVSVPTIAEFFKSQVALGVVMEQAGLADLGTQEFLGDGLGTGKSVA